MHDSQKYLEILLILLQSSRLNLSIRNSDGNTALHYIARITPRDENEKKKLIQILDKVAQSVDIDVLGKSAETPLHQAVSRRNIVGIKFLLDRSANPNALTDIKVSPLLIAVSVKNVEAVKLLLQYGASPTIKSNRGTALDVALANNSSAILQLLEDNKKQNADPDAWQSKIPPLPSRKDSVISMSSGWKGLSVPKSLDDDFESADISNFRV